MSIVSNDGQHWSDQTLNKKAKFSSAYHRNPSGEQEEGDWKGRMGEMTDSNYLTGSGCERERERERERAELL